MKEQDAAHSFDETHPDFPQWIKSRPGLDCMKWPVGDEVYLFNRLSWAFDAGRNCVWDQYVNQTHELTRLRSELQQKDEFIEVLKNGMQKGSEIYAHLRFDDEPFTPYQLAMQEVEKLTSKLQQERELRKELAEVLSFYYSHGYIHGMGYEGKNKIESLIKKSKAK